jgi:hypothetical protein
MTQEQASTTSQHFADMGRQSIDAIVGMQKGFLDAFEELNRQWVSGINAEAALASEFFTKLAAAKSIPDAAIACQGCANRQMEILAENGRRLMTAGEKMVPRLFGNGLGGAGT